MKSSPEGQNRRWFITGASNGMGRALVEQVLADGDAVVATVRTPKALNYLQVRYPHTLEVEVLELRDRASITETVDRVLQRGPINIVVNNAGYGAVGAAEELTDSHIDDQLQTLLHAPITITRAFLPRLREYGGGHIIQMSSVGGQIAYPAASAYHAAKWGLEGFTDAVSREVAGFGIRFTLVEPGGTRTGFGSALQFAYPLAAYQTGPVADFRAHVCGGNENYTGDAAKVASIIVDVTKMPNPPLRLALGRDAYTLIDAALRERLRELTQYRALSCSVAHGD